MLFRTLIAAVAIGLLAGCQKPSFYGEYSNYDKTALEFRKVELMEPDFFSYERFAQREGKIYPRFSKKGKFIRQEGSLFIPTVSDNNGLTIYLTDPSYEQIQIGTDEWRETLYRVK